MSNTELLELLQPRLRDRTAIPTDFEPITVRISLASEGLIVRSMLASLKGGSEFYATLEGRSGGAVRFWKKRRAKGVPCYKGAVATI